MRRARDGALAVPGDGALVVQPNAGALAVREAIATQLYLFTLWSESVSPCRARASRYVACYTHVFLQIYLRLCFRCGAGSNF